MKPAKTTLTITIPTTTTPTTTTPTTIPTTTPGPGGTTPKDYLTSDQLAKALEPIMAMLNTKSTASSPNLLIPCFLFMKQA